jgi:hypothetical protein
VLSLESELLELEAGEVSELAADVSLDALESTLALESVELASDEATLESLLEDVLAGPLEPPPQVFPVPTHTPPEQASMGVQMFPSSQLRALFMCEQVPASHVSSVHSSPSSQSKSMEHPLVLELLELPEDGALEFELELPLSSHTPKLQKSLQHSPADMHISPLARHALEEVPDEGLDEASEEALLAQLLVSTGQSVLLPVQVSAGSQSPVDARHCVPAGV